MAGAGEGLGWSGSFTSFYAAGFHFGVSGGFIILFSELTAFF